MPDYRQPIQEYMRACEALLKLELTNEESEAVEDCMVGSLIDLSTTASREGVARLSWQDFTLDEK